MVNKLYKSIARKNGISEKEVETEINRAIAEAYEHSDAFKEEFPGSAVPDAEEVIAHIIAKINRYYSS